MTTDNIRRAFIPALAAALVVGLLGSLRAQDAGALQAPVPRLAKAPEMSSWTVTYQYKVADPYPKTSNPLQAQFFERLRKENPRLQSMLVTKAGDKMKEVLKYDDGTETVRWFSGDFLANDLRISHLVTVGNFPHADVLSRPDFEGLGWIGKANFLGRQSHQGIPCFVYVQAGNSETTAYIDAKTGLPLAVEGPDVTLIYQFGSASGGVDVPERISQQVKAYEASLHPKAY